MQLAVIVRDLEPADLADLHWSGGPEHLQALASAWQRTLTGEAVVVVAALANGRPVACGALDLRRYPGAGLLWMLAVHETLQGLGIGSGLVAALEARALEHGLDRVLLHVEYDNPRAAALYRRLGYAEAGLALESWAVGPRRTYVTVSALLCRRLPQPPQ